MGFEAGERWAHELGRNFQPIRPSGVMTPEMEETLNLRLAGGPRAPARARHALDSLNGVLDELRLRSDVDLLVSELITNSVRHSGAGRDATIELVAKAATDKVRIEVSDEGPGFDPVAEARREHYVGGYGLKLVDQLANRWGTSKGPRARVWFEIDRREEQKPDPGRIRAVR